MAEKLTMSLAKAQEITETMPDDLAELLRHAIGEAVAQGWDVADFILDNDRLVLRPHTGVMVAVMLDEYTARALEVAGGEQELHITLAFLGEADDLTPEQQRILVGVVAEVVEAQPPLYGYTKETGTFPPGDSGTPWFAVPVVPGLVELRERLVAALQDAGLPVDVETHPDYHPHITLAYLETPEDGDAEVPPFALHPVTFDVNALTVAIGGHHRTLQFGGQREAATVAYPGEPANDWWEARDAWFRAELGTDYWDTPRSAFHPLVKSVVAAEKRFTLGPWYIPDFEDAHGEWTDADELQSAVWKYVDSGYRAIHLQHSPDIVGGRWVELMTLPWPMEVPVIDVNGTTVAHQYPAGTVMMGVIWEPWAWELVKSGAITGYSIGGNAYRTDEQPPTGGADVEQPLEDEEL